MAPTSFTRRRLLGGLAAAACSVALAPRALAAANPPALLLAREAPDDIDPAPYLVSEKYDGVRALWDGRQLRLRSGQVASAPADWRAGLPAVPLDGELWAGRGRFDEASGRARRQAGVAADWAGLQFMVFELPDGAGVFSERAATLRDVVAQARCPWLQAVDQQHLPTRAALQARLAAVVQAGGEGLVLHRADAPYLTGRSEVLLKLKPEHDAEATVVALLPGRGRLAGRLGALRVRTDAGAVFDLGTGFSDALRDAPPPPGSRITYRHRGHTPAGLPRFASFLRVAP